MSPDCVNGPFRIARAGLWYIFKRARRGLRRHRGSQYLIHCPFAHKTFQQLIFCSRLNTPRRNLLIGSIHPKDERHVRKIFVQLTHHHGWVRLEQRHLEERYFGAVFLKYFQ